MITKGWEEVVLEDIVDILGDGLHGTPKYDENGEYYFINGNNLEGKIIIDDKTKKVGYEEYLKYRKELNDRTILISINGTLGKIAVYNGENIVLGKSACYFNIKKSNSKEFVKYVMHSDQFKNYLHTHSTGTTIKNMGLKQMRAFKFYLPPFPEQKVISKILSDLDTKIEVNNQINKKLEEMAQAIFKQWFVDFEFPNEDGEPYKSSGGEMVESEMGEIPKGWSVHSLYDLAEYINGTSFKKDEISENKGIPIIKIAELKQGISNTTKYCVSKKDEKYYLINGDILFSWSGNPETSIDTFIWYRGDGVLNQHTFKVLSTLYSNQFMYLVLKYFKPIFMKIASNKQTTGLGHVTVSDLKRLKITLPNQEFMRKVCYKIDSIISEIHTSNLENNRLSELRDTLLPKLMSGEIRVPINN
jgi:Restriction endonuclease S subunits